METLAITKGHKFPFLTGSVLDRFYCFTAILYIAKCFRVRSYIRVHEIESSKKISTFQNPSKQYNFVFMLLISLRVFSVHFHGMRRLFIPFGIQLYRSEPHNITKTKTEFISIVPSPLFHHNTPTYICR